MWVLEHVGLSHTLCVLKAASVSWQTLQDVSVKVWVSDVGKGVL